VALMLASVLNSEKAIQASIQIVRAFVRLRELLATHHKLARKLEEMEKKYNAEFKVTFEVIQQLTEPPEEPERKPIGFTPVVIWISTCCVLPPSGGFSRSSKRRTAAEA
jgi:hypothetical protein